jgi:hypothetical protein
MEARALTPAELLEERQKRFDQINGDEPSAIHVIGCAERFWYLEGSLSHRASPLAWG